MPPRSEHVSPTGHGAGAATVTGADRIESSADETTPIVRKKRGDGPAASSSATGTSATQAPEAAGDPQTSRRKNKQPRAAENDGGKQGDGFWKGMLEKYGAMELDNKGSVARDHLALGACLTLDAALPWRRWHVLGYSRSPFGLTVRVETLTPTARSLERTFLAWLRTSLAFASIGIAITQLFRLNTTLSEREDMPSQPVDSDNQLRLKQFGKPLGATFLGIAIVILFIGWRRYFESQVRSRPRALATTAIPQAQADVWLVPSSTGSRRASSPRAEARFS